jgi:O-acetyl-ADP-ribose deacetylase (regulator of RNase III)
MIRIVSGDLLDAKEDIIGHQVNCQGRMSSGLALDIAGRFPEAYSKYRKLCMSTYIYPNKLLGELLVVEDGKHIANFFGQDRYGREGIFTSERALIGSIEKLIRRTEDPEDSLYGKSIALPYGIGCGRGGGDWNRIYRLISRISGDIMITLYKEESKIYGKPN